MGQKLPKQWKHWCQQAGLRRHGPKGRNKGRYAGAWFYLQGRGRMWRLNCHGRFECGDTYAEFDRWALCTIEDAPRPSTLWEFKATVAELLERQTANKTGSPRAA